MGELRFDRVGSATLIALVFVAGLIAGATFTAYVTFQQVSTLKSDISNLRNQVSSLSGNQTIFIQNNTIYQNGTVLTELYETVRNSIVLIRTATNSGEDVQGSGFVYNYSDGISQMMVVITNNHVVHDAKSISVTFSNGNGYAASINGTDKYADLAVLTVNAPANEFEPLQIISSSTLRVGEPVVAVGNPYGLVGSMTTGVVSALGRTITEEEYTGGFAIANIIQTSAPINPGNSGGPLLNYLGGVVGVTTAIVEDSQGLGFAVPSNTILKEIESLVRNGGYDGHSYLGLKGEDMSYERAQELSINITYGWRVVSYMNPSPARAAGIQIDDIIVAMNGTKIKSSDDVASYLEEKTIPTQTVVVTVMRIENQLVERTVNVVLGKRP